MKSVAHGRRKSTTDLRTRGYDVIRTYLLDTKNFVNSLLKLSHVALNKSTSAINKKYNVCGQFY